jgi:hypothetical protein
MARIKDVSSRPRKTETCREFISAPPREKLEH